MKLFLWIPLLLAEAGGLHAAEVEDPISKIVSRASIFYYFTISPPYGYLVFFALVGFLLASAIPKWRAKLYSRPLYFVIAALLPLGVTVVGILTEIGELYHGLVGPGLFCAPAEYCLAELILQRNCGLICTALCLILGGLIYWKRQR